VPKKKTGEAYPEKVVARIQSKVEKKRPAKGKKKVETKAETITRSDRKACRGTL